MQDYEQAIATYDRVGQFYAQQGFALKAIAVYKQIRELIRKHAPQLDGSLRPHRSPTRRDLHPARADQRRARRVRRGCRRAIRGTGRIATPSTSSARWWSWTPPIPCPTLRLAEACCRVQNLDEAIDAFWTAAELLLKLERRDDALKVIERILHFRQDPKYARMAAELYLQKGRREDGLQALAKLQVAFRQILGISTPWRCSLKPSPSSGRPTSPSRSTRRWRASRARTAGTICSSSSSRTSSKWRPTTRACARYFPSRPVLRPPSRRRRFTSTTRMSRWSKNIWMSQFPTSRRLR